MGRGIEAKSPRYSSGVGLHVESRAETPPVHELYDLTRPLVSTGLGDGHLGILCYTNKAQSIISIVVWESVCVLAPYHALDGLWCESYFAWSTHNSREKIRSQKC